jgi:hypothetical protein
VTRSEEVVCIPRLRAVVVSLGILVLIGILVFLQRYRGADRTAIALSILGGAGFCLVVALFRFHCKFSDHVMTRLSLWGIGLRSGAAAGLCATVIGVVLLAVRWAIDQQERPAGDLFLPAFLHALASLGRGMAASFPAYMAVGAVVGALLGLVVAEAIAVSAKRMPPLAPPSEADAEKPSS